MINCNDCPDKPQCTQLCPDAERYADQDYIGQREAILPDDTVTAASAYGRYNDALAEMIEDRRQRDAELLEAIRSIDHIPHRAIMAMLLCGITQAQAATLVHKNQSYISRISQRYLPQ